MRRNTPPLLQRMMERKVGELVVFKTTITEPRTGFRVAYDFPTESAAANAALRMNDVVDWFGVIKARAEGKSPNSQAELERIVADFGGKLATGNAHSGMAEAACAKVVAAVERS